MRAGYKTAFIIMSIISLPSVAQTKVSLSGKVMDSALLPISNAVITTSHSASSISAEDGSFSILLEAGDNIKVKTSHLSYQTDEKYLDMQKDTTIYIILKERNSIIEGASVSADKPRIFYRNSNMIIDLSDMPSFETHDMQYVLKRIPGVSTSKNDGVRLNGLAAAIEIDGRKIQFDSKGIASYLQSMPASTVKEIELHINGDGTQSASDAGAVINLITRKQSIDGYYISLNASGNLYFPKEINADGRGTAMFVLKKRNIILNAYLQYRNDWNRSLSIDSTTYMSNQPTLFQQISSNGRLDTYNGEINLNWEVAKGHKLNINVFGYEDFDRTREIENRRLEYRQHNIYNTVKGNDDLWTATLEYTSPDSAKNQYSLYYDFSYGGIRQSNSFIKENETHPYVKSNAGMQGLRHTASFDYAHFFSEKLKLGAGLKAELGKLNDKVIYEAKEISENNFSGNENIYQGYMQVEWTPSKQWSLLAAARVEHTDYRTSSDQKISDNRVSYTDIFPYFTLNFKTRDKNYNGTISFLSQIERPNYRYMLPGMRFQNDYSQSYGNPYMNPTYTYSFRLNNYILDFIVLTFRYDWSRDIIGQVLHDNNGVRQSFYNNFADRRRLYAFLCVPFLLAKNRISGQLTAEVYRDKIMNPKSNYKIIDNRNCFWGASFQLFADYKIHEQFSINLYSYYEPYKKTPLFDMKQRWSIDAGMSFTTKNKKTVISLDVEDIFNSYKNGFKYRYETGTYSTYKQINTRFVKLSIFCKLSEGEKVSDKGQSNKTDISRFKE